MPRGRSGQRVVVARIKLVYWALIVVLGALAFFLLAAGARVLLGRRGGADADAA